MSEEALVYQFGKTGHFYYNIVRGIDNRTVQPHRETKSLAAEDTFAYDLTELHDMELKLEQLAEIVQERLKKKNLSGRTITLKIKYSDFKQITRNKSFSHPVADLKTIVDTAKSLLVNTEPEGKKIRLLGISMSNFGNIHPKPKGIKHVGQLRLF